MGKDIGDYQQKIYNLIRPKRIYNSRETARLLRVERSDVINSIVAGKLKGLLVNRNYRILGKNIQENLRR